MSNYDGSDSEFDGFQGLQLKSPSQPAGDFLNKPLDISHSQTDHDETDEWFGDSESKEATISPRNFETKFSGAFGGGESMFGKKMDSFGGFGESSDSEDVEDDSEGVKKDKEQFVGLDWDANSVFKHLACVENDQEKSVCVLRLHDILTKSEMAIQKITRQMIHCGSRIQKCSEHERRSLGFADEHNVKMLRQVIDSLRACSKLMLIETDDLQEVLQPTFRPKEPGSSRSSTVLRSFSALGIAAIPAVAFYLYRSGVRSWPQFF